MSAKRKVTIFLILVIISVTCMPHEAFGPDGFMHEDPDALRPPSGARPMRGERDRQTRLIQEIIELETKLFRAAIPERRNEENVKRLTSALVSKRIELWNHRRDEIYGSQRGYRESNRRDETTERRLNNIRNDINKMRDMVGKRLENLRNEVDGLHRGLGQLREEPERRRAEAPEFTSVGRLKLLGGGGKQEGFTDIRMVSLEANMENIAMALEKAIRLLDQLCALNRDRHRDEYSKFIQYEPETRAR